MPAVVIRGEELRSLLKQTARAHGLHCTPTEHGWMQAELETTLARWYFGGRNVTYYVGCRLDEDNRTVRFREVVKESTWGLPAPFLTAEKATVTGTRVPGTRPEGEVRAGPVEHFKLRTEIEHAVREAGWRFVLESGKP